MGVNYMLAMTTDFHGTSRNTVEIRATLEKIAKAGFSHVHWCHEWTSFYLYSVHEMLQIRKWCDELNLGVKGVHATAGEPNSDLKNYYSANDYNRLAGIELVKNRVDLAYILNAEAIVLHLIMPLQQLEKEERIQENHLLNIYKAFDELEPYCKTRHIRLCIENCRGHPNLICSILDALYERYSADFLGFCFDTGHACIYCKENQLVYAERYNERLYMIHVHDNHGETDEHLIPFEGHVDWEGFTKVLAHSPYSLPILIESQCSKETEDDSTWLEKAFKEGNRITTMVEKCKMA
jgi:sugar phosphate isomerase/epimerase